MLRGALLLFLFGVAVSGCSSVPPFDAPEDLTGVPTVSQVIDKINCEILEARDDPANDNKQFNQFLIETLRIQEFKYWQASVTLTLTVNDTVGLYPSSTGVTLSYIDPLRIAGTSFMFSGSVMLYQSRARTYTQQYSIDISKINPENCGKDWHRRFNLEGDLGIRDQIAMGLHSFEQTEKGGDVRNKCEIARQHWRHGFLSHIQGRNRLGPELDHCSFQRTSGRRWIQSRRSSSNRFHNRAGRRGGGENQNHRAPSKPHHFRSIPSSRHPVPEAVLKKWRCT